MDQLAAESVRFANAFAQGTWTRPSAGSLWTGCYPAVHGAYSMERGLRPGLATMAARLRHRGYRTAAFVSIGQLSRAAGFGEGFDWYEELWRTAHKKDSVDASTSHADLVSDAEVIAAAEKWLDARDSAKPCFVLLWTMGTHVPYQLPPSNRRKFALDDAMTERLSSLKGLWGIRSEQEFHCLHAMYDEAIRASDAVLGEFVQYLRDQGLYDDTLLLVLGDHGEVFNEHSRSDHLRHAWVFRWARRLPVLGSLLSRYRVINRWSMAGHLDVLPYDEVLRVPLILTLSGRGWEGRVPEDAVQIVDLLPTIMDLLDDQRPTEGVQGQSLVPVVQGVNGAPRAAYSDSQRNSSAPRFVSVRDRGWKLVQIEPGASYVETGRRPGLQERAYRALERRWSPDSVLFRLGDEGHDRSQEAPQLKAELAGSLDKWRLGNLSLAEGLSERTAHEDQEVLVRLRALGYLD
jgi:arylsulfatase A-like enzyme